MVERGIWVKRLLFRVRTSWSRGVEVRVRGCVNRLWISDRAGTGVGDAGCSTGRVDLGA